jgi:hypothetical protein
MEAMRELLDSQTDSLKHKGLVHVSWISGNRNSLMTVLMVHDVCWFMMCLWFMMYVSTELQIYARNHNTTLQVKIYQPTLSLTHFLWTLCLNACIHTSVRMHTIHITPIFE